jgi:hypothetical protein
MTRVSQVAFVIENFYKMKLLRASLSVIVLITSICSSTFCLPDSGFFIPDSVKEVTLRYRTVQNLIVLPVVINNFVSVNLILDTGCRNLVLFGKKFENLFQFSKGREVKFSGLGTGASVSGQIFDQQPCGD